MVDGPGRIPANGASGGGSSIPSVASWLDLDALEPAEVGSLRLVPASSFSGATRTGNVLAERYADKWDTAVNAAILQYLAAHPIPNNAPTVPSAKAIIGRSQSLDLLFGGSGNSNSWWGYNGGITPGAGPQRLTYRFRVYNKSDDPITTVALPILGLTPSNAEILAIWAGTSGTNQTPSGQWQRMTIGGQNTYLPPSGTGEIPSSTQTDELVLADPVAKNDSVIFCVVFESSGEITQFDSFGGSNDSRNAESTLSKGWLVAGDLGSDQAHLTATPAGSWYTWDSCISHVFVRYDGAPRISISFVGDSVINGFRYYVASDNNPRKECRDSWAYQSELLFAASGKRVSLANYGNGGYGVVQYCQRATALLPVWKNWTDIQFIEGWSPNNAPTSIGDNAPLKTAVGNLVAACIATGISYAIFFPAPPGQIMPSNAGAADSLADMISWATTTFPGRVIDGHSILRDPNNPNHYASTWSDDDLHQVYNGNVEFARVFEPLVTAQIEGQGYTP